MVFLLKVVVTVAINRSLMVFHIYLVRCHTSPLIKLRGPTNDCENKGLTVFLPVTNSAE